MLDESVKRVLMIDNYDSFTYNLVHYLKQLDCEVIVKRNNQLSLDEIESLNPTHVIISPGPKSPDQAGISLAVIDRFESTFPILGVCLGHQVIGQAFGGKIVAANSIMHGKTSQIYHSNLGMFAGLPQGFNATRYHSLVVDLLSIPDCLEVTAWTLDADGNIENIMGVMHRQLPIEGVQFHPESVLSQHGLRLLRNFLQRVA